MPLYNMDKILLSSTRLHNPIWVAGISEPLLSIADILDAQDRVIYGDACRQAAEICQAFAQINLLKTHELVDPKTL